MQNEKYISNFSFFKDTFQYYSLWVKLFNCFTLSVLVYLFYSASYYKHFYCILQFLKLQKHSFIHLFHFLLSSNGNIILIHCLLWKRYLFTAYILWLIVNMLYLRYCQVSDIAAIVGSKYTIFKIAYLKWNKYDKNDNAFMIIYISIFNKALHMLSTLKLIT